MAILITLHLQNAKTWIMAISRIVETGSVSRKELESAIAGLSIAKTSVFGRIGRAMLGPLYTKIHLRNHYRALSLKEAAPLRRHAVSISHMKHRKDTPKPPTAERIFYTDASGKTEIISVSRLTPETFASSDRLGPARSPKNSRKWRSTFENPCYIYGLEVLAALPILLGRRNELRDKSVTFYIDNDNSICELIKNTANPPEIQAAVGLIWHSVRDLRITPWFERVPPETRHFRPDRAQEEDHVRYLMDTAIYEPSRPTPDRIKGD